MNLCLDHKIIRIIFPNSGTLKTINQSTNPDSDQAALFAQGQL